ncbi:hypothetical protein Y046_6015 [Burkholderia pseudomallei MSHR2990]|nr:hypothetical protein Y046_6015 [Burkholderia pseudomallei MSHR2990]
MPNYLANCTCKILHVQVDYRPLTPEFKGGAVPTFRHCCDKLTLPKCGGAWCDVLQGTSSRICNQLQVWEVRGRSRLTGIPK